MEKTEAKPKPQTSRKGKKAWRKNILVDDINSALEAKREKEVLHGKDSNADDDFVIDTKGSGASKTPVFVLRTTEILSNKSKVPALVPRKTKAKVSKARANKLMVLAGKSATDSKGIAKTDSDGLVKGSNVDLWGDDSVDTSKIEVGPSTISYTKATRAPRTLKQQPIALHTELPDELVHAGKSYNPSLESWQSLIDREFTTENENQMKAQALEDERERIQVLMRTLQDEELLSDSEDENDNVEENEVEADDDEKYRLSVNEKVEVKRKTRTRRNREARHKQREALGSRLRELKVQLRDIANLVEIEKQVNEKESKTAQKSVVEKKYKKHGKHDPSFKPIEVKLSDELTNNLRAVKPEGNPFYEQMHKLQMSGKVEAAVPIKHKNRYRQKTTEKWSYKAFK